MTDYERMKHVYDELKISYTESSNDSNKTIFVDYTNVEFVFDATTEEYMGMDIGG